MSVLGYHLIDDRLKVSRGDLLDMIRPDRSATLNKRHNHCFVGGMSESVFWPLSRFTDLRTDPQLSTDVGFVHFHGSVKWAFRGLFHCITDSVSHEPSTLESNAQGPVKLVCAYAFLRSRHKIDGLKPDTHGNMAVFKDGADLNRERLPASVAFVSADPVLSPFILLIRTELPQ